MDRRDYQACCAVCGGPADPDCTSGCESARLNMAIAQAESQWLEKWREKTREWVANHAIRHVTSTFQAMKETRLANYQAYVKALPYWPIYEQYQGRPPLHATALADLRRQIYEADAELRRNIDADWRQCVIRYPEVLTHYFSMVGINMPKEVTAPTNVIPTIPSLLPQSRPPLERARSTTGASNSKKTRRNSKTASIKGSDFSIETISKLFENSGLANQGLSNGLPHDVQGGVSSAGMGGNLPHGYSNGLHGNGIHGNGLHGNGLHGNGLHGNGLHGNGLSGLAGLASMPGMGGMTGIARSNSKAGRTTPVQDGIPTRPSGKKRHSKDFIPIAGRATAPLPHAPYAPPGMPQSYFSGRMS